MRHRIITPKKSIWNSWFVALLLIAVIIWMGSVVFKAFAKYQDVKTARDESKNELQELQAKSTDLEQKIETLSSDYGFNQEIRSQYRVVRPGEEMVIIVDNDKVSESETDSGETFWDKLRSFIGL